MKSAMPFLISLLFGCAVLAGCGQQGYVTIKYDDRGSEQMQTGEETSEFAQFGELENEDSFSGECSILLGDIITIIGGGAMIEDNRISITEGGVYSIFGSIDDGMISVDCADTVKLVLHGASLKSGGAAISGERGKLVIECAENSKSFLCGGGQCAALYGGGSKLVVCGKGSLEVNGGGAPAIETKGKLKLACRSVTARSGAQALCAESVETAEGTEVVIEEE